MPSKPGSCRLSISKPSSSPPHRLLPGFLQAPCCSFPTDGPRHLSVPLQSIPHAAQSDRASCLPKDAGLPRLKSPPLLPKAALTFPKPLGSLAAPPWHSGPLPSPRHTLSSHNSEPWDRLFCLPSLWSDRLLHILFKVAQVSHCL